MGKLKTFKGGIHPEYNKELSSSKAIRPAPIPERLIVPLSQHVGAPCDPIVSAGERVELGQKVGHSEAYVSAYVHSPVTGVVEEIVSRKNFAGQTVTCVVIAADKEQADFPKRSGFALESFTGEQIREIARDAGLVGMGGAAFPTHVKLSPPKDKPVDTVIINACECEPFLTCDYRLMIERADDLISGALMLKKAVGAERVIIGVEANKQDAADILKSKASGTPEVSVELIEVKYPQGAEKMLIYALTGRKVPPGKLPSEVGCLVQNVGTAVALFEAVAWGKPLYERVVTVTGPGINEPANLLVRVGTPISVLIDACGGYSREAPGKLIMGGPMTGWAQEDASTPVVKGTSGVVVLGKEAGAVVEESECVSCGKCIIACPMMLTPNLIVRSAKRGQWDRAKEFGALDCFECGCCSFECPAYIPHIKYVRRAKSMLATATK